VTGRRGRRRKQILDDLQEEKGCWELEEDALDRAKGRNGFGSGCGHVVRSAVG
jgi:hypothetical protein